jgi:nucleoside-diphosphate-sugar epimerase
MAQSERRVLVTGAAGVLGSRLVSRLLAAGFKVRGLILPGDPARASLLQLGCEIWEGDIRDEASLRGCCADVAIVYHLAAIIISYDPTAFERINRQGTAHVVAEAAASGVRQFVYVSSASVTYPKRTPYAQSKLEAERLVAAASFQHTIVRPTLVYDRQGGQELQMFLDYLRRFPIVPFIGAGAALKRPVLSDDIVEGLVALADREIAYGKTYNFSGAEPISMLDFARLLLRHHAKPKPIVHVPVAVCVAAARVLARFMERPPLTLNAIAGVINDANLDPSEAMRDLGYNPIGVREGFERCFPIAPQRFVPTTNTSTNSPS